MIEEKFIDRIGKVYANKRLKVACMGFRELVKFNETMLAKQVQGLIHDTDSLFYRAFKEKYFNAKAKYYQGPMLSRVFFKLTK